MRPFILTWMRTTNNEAVSRKTVLDALDQIPEVANWRGAIGAIFIASDHSATELTEKLRAKLPDIQFIIAPIDISLAQGWADKDTWDFLHRPRRSGVP